MHEGSFLLLILLVASILGKNDLLALAALSVLILHAVGSEAPFAFLERFGVQLGVVFLLIGLLLPFSNGTLGIDRIRSNLLTPSGFVAVVVGALSAYLASEGVALLSLRPEVLVGLVVGSILGVAWFDGIPAGPLVAGGLTAMLFKFLRL